MYFKQPIKTQGEKDTSQIKRGYWVVTGSEERKGRNAGREIRGGGKGKNSREVLVQRINMDVCIRIRHTNNHHVALQTKMALLGGLFTVPCIKPESTLCTRTATQPKIGAWAV